MLQLGLMGRPYVVGPHGPVLLSTRKGEALLWYLAAQPEKEFTRGHLAGLLWEGSDEPSARRTLTTVLVTLRRALPVFPLRVTRDVLSWDPDAHVQMDIVRFCREAGIEGSQAPTLQGRDEKQLAAALALRRGPFLDGFSVPDSAEYQAWLEQQRHLWNQRVLAVLERLAGLAEAACNWEALASHSRAALAIDPLQESFHRWLMIALAALGNRSEALVQYEACRRILDAELAVAPDPATTALRDAIAAGALPHVRMSGAAAYAPRVDPQQSRSPSAPPLVGRDAELRRVLTFLQPGSGGPRAVLLHGEAGIGKTRLVRAVSDLSASWAQTVITGHCYETSKGFPFTPFVQVLATVSRRSDLDRLDLPNIYRREVGRLWPELMPQSDASGVALGPPFPITEHGRDPQVLFEAVVKLLVALPAPVLLVLEDLHWADEMSLYLLAHLIRHPLAEDVAVLATARAEDLSESSAVLLRQLQREERLYWEDLTPLPLPALRTLVASMTGKEDTALADRLHKDTRGNPLFAVELLRALSEHGRTEAVPPATLRAVVGSKLLGLPSEARELSAAVSVFERPVPLSLAQEVAGLTEEEAVQALDALLRVRILEEAWESPPDWQVGQPPVAFHHDLVSRVVREEMSAARRARLHRRAFHALSRAAQGLTGKETVAAEALAEHATQGQLWAEGVTWNLHAAKNAMRSYAYSVASFRLHQALQCLAQLPETPDRYRQSTEIRLHLAHIELLVGSQDATEHLADLMDGAVGEPSSESQYLLMQALALNLMLRGHLAAAEQLLKICQSFVRARPEQEQWLPYTLTHLGQLQAIRGDYLQAVTILEQAVRSGNQTLIHIAEGLGTLGTVLAALGEFERAEVVVRDMAEEGRQRGDRAMVALASAHLSSVFHARGDWSAAIAAAEEAMELAVEGHMFLPEYLSTVYLALPLARTGQLTLGIRAAERATSLAERAGLRILLDQVYACLAQMLLELGDLPSAMRAAARAEEIARADGYLYGLALSAKVRGILEERSGSVLTAREYLADAIQRFTTLGAKPELARCHALLSRVTEGEEQETHRRKAQTMFRSMGMTWYLDRLATDGQVPSGL